MTLDEAKIIAKLIGFADSACSNCVSALTEQANRLFPQFTWTYIGESAYDEVRYDWQGPLDDAFEERYLTVNVEPRHD